MHSNAFGRRRSVSSLIADYRLNRPPGRSRLATLVPFVEHRLSLFRKRNTLGLSMSDGAVDAADGVLERGRLDRMRELVEKAQSTFDSPDERRGDAAAIRAGYLAQLQRLSGWALRDAVTDARLRDMTWRWLAVSCQLPVGTLHRQYSAGGRIVVGDNVTQHPNFDEPNEKPAPTTRQKAPSDG